MENALDHTLLSSFKEFLSFKINNDLQAFSNKSLGIYEYSPVRQISGKSFYGSAYSQWLYDSSVSGVQVPSGIGSLNRGTSGLSIDFKNGRFLVDSGVALSGQVNVSVPDFNIYLTSSSVQKILLEKKYLYKPNLVAANQPIPPDSIVAPCIFLSYTNTTNEEWALGGIKESEFSVQVAVFADNIYKLIGIQKVIRDITRKIFPLIPFTPLNELNDLKYGYWNYQMISDYEDDINNFAYIDQTTFRILDLDYINQEHPNILVGLGNVKIAKYRSLNRSDDPIYPTIYQEEDEVVFYTFDDGTLSEVTS